MALSITKVATYTYDDQIMRLFAPQGTDVTSQHVEEKPAIVTVTSKDVSGDLIDPQDKTDSHLSRDDQILTILRMVYERVAAGQRPFAGFVEIIDEIDWSTQSPLVFDQAIRMALALDAVKIARTLADFGHQIYPNNEDLARAARILAPPRVVETKRPPIKGLSESMAWLQEHAVEFSGLWVAIQGGKLLGTATSRKEVMAVIDTLTDKSNILIGRIP